MNDRDDPLKHVAGIIDRNPDLKRAYERLAPRYEVINQLIQERLRAGITPTELARRMGVRPAVLYRIIGGETSPRLDELVAVADALDCDLDVNVKPRRQANAARSNGARSDANSARTSKAGATITT